MYTYKNKFHKTEYRSKFSPEEMEAISYRIYAHIESIAERELQRRMQRALCGYYDCQCGDRFGRRG